MAKLFTRLITSFIILIIVVLLALLIGVRSQTTPLKAQCVSSEDRERIRNIMLEALDQGLKDHTMHMFEIWLKDNTEQPSRAITGMQNGILAYTRSRAAAMRFNPPPC